MKIAFDPGALVQIPGVEAQLAEAILERDPDDARGRLTLELWDDFGNGLGTITLRADFLDAAIAAAAREQAA